MSPTHHRCPKIAIAFVTALLLSMAVASLFSTRSAASSANQTVPPLPTPTSTAITVTMWTYDDLNNNGWRDPSESPYLPSYIGAVYCYHFASPACGYDSGSYRCLSYLYDNSIALPRSCSFTVTRMRALGWDFPTPFGTFRTGENDMSIYFPLGGKPDNLLGTPTPTFTPTPTQTFTPTPTFTHTATPTNTTTPTQTFTPTPKPDAQPDATATPRPSPGNIVFLPNVNK